MLDRLVNDSTDILSTNLSICTFLIPDSIAIDKLEAGELPQNWDDHPYINDTQQIGSQWLQQCSSAVLQVPSSLCADEYNFIINPAHPDSAKITCIDCKAFQYPNRLAAKL